MPGPATMDAPQDSPLLTALLEQPWLVVVSLCGLGLVLLFIRQRSVRRRSLWWTGLACLGAAAGLIVLAAVIETPKERIERQTAHFVEAALAGDVGAVDALLQSDLKVTLGRDLTRLDKRGVLKWVPLLARLVNANNVREIQAGASWEGEGVAILLQTTSTSLAYPVPNQWRLRWVREADGQWRISELIWEKWRHDEVPNASFLRIP